MPARSGLFAVIVASLILVAAPLWAQDAKPAPPPEGRPQNPAPPPPGKAQDQPRRPPGGGEGRFANARIPDEVQLVRDVVYAQVPGDDGKSIDLKMDTAFLKQSDGKPMPVVVYIHGGGWKSGAKQVGLPQTVAFALGGYFAATIEYRLSDQAKYPAAVHDCKAAIRFLRANAAELGIDPERIGVWGHSAGAHLAALLGTSGNTDVLDGKVGTTGPGAAVQCVVDISGPVDLTIDSGDGVLSQWFGGPVREHEDLAKQASPLTYIDAKDPPVLIIHGTEDRLVNIHRQAEVFEKALKDAGVPVEYMPVEGSGHAIVNPRVFVRTADFFDAHLQGKAAQAIREYFGEALNRRGGGEGGDETAPPRRRAGQPGPDQAEPAPPAAPSGPASSKPQ